MRERGLYRCGMISVSIYLPILGRDYMHEWCFSVCYFLFSLPNQVKCLPDRLEWFQCQDVRAWLAYLTTNVASCINQFWCFISILYIRNVCSRDIFWAACLVLSPYGLSDMLAGALLCVISLLFSVCNSGHFNSDSDLELKNNLVFLPLCLMWMSVASRIFRGFTSHLFPYVNISVFSIKSPLQYSTAGCWQHYYYFLKLIFPHGIPGGWRVHFHVHKISYLNLTGDPLAFWSCKW